MTTVAQLIAAAHVHRAALGGDHGFTLARKALLRVAESAGALPTAVPAEGVLARHAALREACALQAKAFAEEHGALRRLQSLPALPAEMAQRIFAGTPTLADALTAIALQQDPERWKAQKSALQRVIARVSPAKTGADVPATERQLEQKLATLFPTDFGLKESSFRTFKTNVRRAARLVDLHRRQTVHASMLTGRWRALIAEARALAAKDSSIPAPDKAAVGGALAKVWPLVEYCWRHGIAIDAVHDASVAGLRAELAARQVARPLEVARNAVYGWERLQATVPGWPATKLPRVYQEPGAGSPHDIPESELPAPLRAAWQAYEARVFATPHGGEGLARAKAQLESLSTRRDGLRDPFAAKLEGGPERPGVETAPGRYRTRKSGLKNFRTAFRYAANAAIVDLGMTPTTLAEIFVPDVLNRVLARRFARQQQRAQARGEDPPSERNTTLKATVATFKCIARDLDQPDSVIEALDAYYDMVHPDFIKWDARNGKAVRIYRAKRIGPLHARMLAQFEGTDGLRKLLAWFRLPARLHDSVRAKLARAGDDPRRLSDHDLCDAITALVAAITRSCPLRRENIGELRIAYAPEKQLGPNIALPEDTGARGRIRLWAGEIKHGSDDIAVWLTPFATEVARFYLATIRPEILRRRGSDPDNPWLFPAEGRRHRALELITRRFAERCESAGFWMDLHCNRHLTAKVILDRDVTAMPLVQRILGHKKLETTKAYYADVNKALADKIFQDHLAAAEHEVEARLFTALKRAA